MIIDLAKFPVQISKNGSIFSNKTFCMFQRKVSGTAMQVNCAKKKAEKFYASKNLVPAETISPMKMMYKNAYGT